MSIQNRLSLVLDSVVEIHALQDGLTIGTLLALSLHYPPAITIIMAALGFQGSFRPKRIISFADRIVRQEDIEQAPEYFLAGLLVSSIGVSGIVVGAKSLGLLANIPL